MRLVGWAALAVWIGSACAAPGSSAGPEAHPTAAAPTEPTATAPASAPPALVASVRSGGSVERDGGSSDAASAPSAAASESVAPFAADNKILPPHDSDDLEKRARALFVAIAHDDPAAAEPFWFPKEPFIPLKDVADPGKYWEQLHAAYARDIHSLYRKRKTWDDASFESFAIGSTPKWVKPGEEANKIGYYRSFRGKLAFTAAGQRDTLEVHTIISWQGRWFITHLSKFKK